MEAGIPELELRFEAADGDVSRKLQEAFFAEIASRYPGWDPDAGPTAEAAELGPPRGAWVVAYLDGRPVGCGGFKSMDADTAEIRRVFLHESARGHGIGRQLLRALEKRARRLGHASVRLNTGDRQPEALALFRSTGYEDVPDFNGYEYASHWLAKEL